MNGTELITERVPLYDSCRVDLQVGGTCARCAPMCTSVFDGRGLSLPDLRSAVGSLHAIRVAGERPLSPDLKLAGGPELLEHPQPVEVWTFLRSAEIGNEAFQDTEYGRLCSTDGWRLGTDPEAGKLLSDLKQAGLRHMWFTVCGLEQTHDAYTERPGSFAAIVTAMKRCRDVGIDTGASILVLKRNIREVRELAQLMRSLGAEKYMQLYPLPGLGEGPAADDSMLEPEDVLGLPPRDLDIDWGQKGLWADPEASTEAALTRTAMRGQSQSGAEPSPKPQERCLWLRVTADFELLAPEAIDRATSLRIANLRGDLPSQVSERLAGIQWPPDPPADQELARLYGDTNSRTLYHSKWSLRRKWLDAWRADNGIPWLPLDTYERPGKGGDSYDPGPRHQSRSTRPHSPVAGRRYPAHGGRSIRGRGGS